MYGYAETHRTPSDTTLQFGMVRPCRYSLLWRTQQGHNHTNTFSCPVYKLAISPNPPNTFSYPLHRLSISPNPTNTFSCPLYELGIRSNPTGSLAGMYSSACLAQPTWPLAGVQKGINAIFTLFTPSPELQMWLIYHSVDASLNNCWCTSWVKKACNAEHAAKLLVGLGQMPNLKSHKWQHYAEHVQLGILDSIMLYMYSWHSMTALCVHVQQDAVQ